MKSRFVPTISPSAYEVSVPNHDFSLSQRSLCTEPRFLHEPEISLSNRDFYCALIIPIRESFDPSCSYSSHASDNSPKASFLSSDNSFRDYCSESFFLVPDKDMGSKMVGVALSNTSRETLLQLTDAMKDFKPDFLGPVLEAQVNCGAAFRCCAHSWTPTHDKLLLKGHAYFIRKFHDDSKKFLLPSGWKKIQEKFKLMDQHSVGLGDLQARFYAMKRGVTDLPKITLYRLWGEKEVNVLTSIYEEIMSVEKPSGKKILLDPADYTDIQQSLWYYLDCCPEMEQVEHKLLEIVQRK